MLYRFQLSILYKVLKSSILLYINLNHLTNNRAVLQKNEIFQIHYYHHYLFNYKNNNSDYYPNLFVIFIYY